MIVPALSSKRSAKFRLFSGLAWVRHSRPGESARCKSESAQAQGGSAGESARSLAGRMAMGGSAGGSARCLGGRQVMGGSAGGSARGLEERQVLGGSARGLEKENKH
jgi:hypothetical protein